MSDPVERAVDAVFGFLWRWFWRILLWGIAGLVALYAIFWMIDQSQNNPTGWMSGVATVAGTVVIGLLFDIRKALHTIIQQNADAARDRRSDHF